MFDSSYVHMISQGWGPGRLRAPWGKGGGHVLKGTLMLAVVAVMVMADINPNSAVFSQY